MKYVQSILQGIVKAAVGRKAVSRALLPELTAALRATPGARVAQYAVREGAGKKFLEVALSDGQKIALKNGNAEVMKIGRASCRERV